MGDTGLLYVAVDKRMAYRVKGIVSEETALVSQGGFSVFLIVLQYSEGIAEIFCSV